MDKYAKALDPASCTAQEERIKLLWSMIYTGDSDETTQNNIDSDSTRADELLKQTA